MSDNSVTAIDGPGDEGVRLVNSFDVCEESSVMQLEDGSGEVTVAVEVASRSLASADDVSTQVLVFTKAQAAYLAGQLWAVSNDGKR